MIFLPVTALLIISDINCMVYFKEEFSNDNWEELWTPSEHAGKELGKFILTPGKFYGDPEISKGIQTSQNARFYALSTKFTPFSNENKVLVVQFSVKNEQNIDCGGGYIKVFDCSLNPRDLHADTPYLIMFGPDICGHEKKKVHVIFNYKEKNLLIKKNIRCKTDVFTHLYTLIVKPDNTYIVKIDNNIVEEGLLEDDWDFLLPRKINEPNVRKPDDWIDDPKMGDPYDKKPEDWDKPEYIPDKEAVKPLDWDEEIDGEWEPPQIKNPEYKGVWKPRLVDNLNYKGPWIHPQIDNPDYVPDPNLYKYDEICGVGFDLWQVKSGTIFDNILISDDELESVQVGQSTWGVIRERERKMKEQDEEREVEDDEAIDDAEDELDENEDVIDSDENEDVIYPDEDKEVIYPDDVIYPDENEDVIDSDENDEDIFDYHDEL